MLVGPVGLEARAALRGGKGLAVRERCQRVDPGGPAGGRARGPDSEHSEPGIPSHRVASTNRHAMEVSTKKVGLHGAGAVAQSRKRRERWFQMMSKLPHTRDMSSWATTVLETPPRPAKKQEPVNRAQHTSGLQAPISMRC